MHWLVFFSGINKENQKNSKIQYRKPRNKTIIIMINIIIVIIIIITLFLMQHVRYGSSLYR